jgi:hypothetical protein
MWIRKEGAFEAIVPPATFYTVQGILQTRYRKLTDEELIQRLRMLYQSRGYLTSLIINETEDMPSAAVYATRFGSLARAYEIVGFNTGRDCHAMETNRFLRRFHPEIMEETERTILSMGGEIRRDPVTDLLTINNEFSASLVLARCQTLDSGYKRWKIRFDTDLAPDITVAVRLDQANRHTLDYYLLPRLEFGQPHIVLGDRNLSEFDCYRFDNLDFLFGMTERTLLRKAA